MKILSIRLSPDGLSFTEGPESGGFRSGQYAFEKSGDLTTGLRAFIDGDKFPQGPFDRVCLFPDTDRMILVPGSLWRDDMAESYLRENGLTVQPGERIVVSALSGETRAVMLCDRETAGLLEQKFPGILYLSPLQAAIAPGGKNELTLLLSPALLYLSYFGERLEYAEVLRNGELADILFYLGRLSPVFDVSKATLRVAGHKDDVLTRQLRRYYKNVETTDHARLYRSAAESI